MLLLLETVRCSLLQVNLWWRMAFYGRGGAAFDNSVLGLLLLCRPLADQMDRAVRSSQTAYARMATGKDKLRRVAALSE